MAKYGAVFASPKGPKWLLLFIWNKELGTIEVCRPERSEGSLAYASPPSLIHNS